MSPLKPLFFLFDSLSTEGEFYLSLNDDGTGMDVEIVEVDEYYETYMDTNISHFEWNASDDSHSIGLSGKLGSALIN